MQKATLNSAIGNIQHWQKTDSGLLLYADIALVKITIWNPSCIQVQATQQNEFDDQSYAISNKPEVTECEVIEELNMVILSTSQLHVEIGLAPFRVTYFDKNKTLLMEDEAAFGISWIGQQCFHYRKLQKNERFIGLGEKTERLDRAGRAYTNWNTDFFAYKDGSDPLYASIPFFMGLHNDVCYGLYYDNTYRSEFNFGASNNRFSFTTAYDGDVNYFLIAGENPGEIIKNYTWLTGRSSMPPRWALGLQQCRYSYYQESEVRTLANTYREKQIPADVIYLDIHYKDAYKVFTWNNERFPNPQKMSDDLLAKGFRLVNIMDPGIKVEAGYLAYQDGLDNDIFVKYPDGETWSAMVWPGWCHFPDFTMAKARHWWGEQLKNLTDSGISGFWTDMNEPATWGQHCPPLLQFDMEGNTSSFNKAHNVYGMQMSRATYEGSLRHHPEKRPFVLTRAGYSGMQRYAALWTGDNVASDDHMLLGIRMLNSIGLSGIPFAGMDIGGFAGDVAPKTYARWITLGAFMPLCRIHTMINNRDTEPWALGESIEVISRNYISLRYRLMSYFYSCFYQHTQDGMPIQRSLAIDFPNEGEVYWNPLDNQFFCGPSLMIAPCSSDKEYLKVYFPGKDSEEFFYNLWTDEPYLAGSTEVVECPLHLLPVFARPGAIIPIHKTTMHTGESPGELLELHLYYRSTGETTFAFYDDGGDGFEYLEGAYAKRVIKLNSTSLTISTQEGTHDIPFKTLKLIFHGFDTLKEVTVGTEIYKLLEEKLCWLEPLPNIDPLGDEMHLPMYQGLVCTFALTTEAIEMSWKEE